MENYSVVDLPLETGEKSIFGTIYLPNETRQGKRVPLVIYAHGIGTHHESGDAYAREFARRGSAVYCLDFGGIEGSQTDGEPNTMTVFTEQRELEETYDELAKLPYVDLNNVFFMGASLGGAASALAAANLNGLIKGLILLYPAFNVPGEIRRKCSSREELPETYEFFTTTVGKPFLETLYDFDFYEVITNYMGPVLILHGMGDSVVASGYSVRAVNMYHRANLELIGEVGHGFEGGAFKFAVKKIVGFLDEEADLADESGLEGDLNFGGGGMGGGMGGMFG